MKEATIRFYAELNDFLPAAGRARPLSYRFFVEPAVKDVIESFGVPHTEVDLVILNGQSAAFTDRIRDGDRIAVYPMFEAIDIRPLLKVRPEPLRTIRFVLDAHLGRLAAYLRMLGFDTRYSNRVDDAELAGISRNERRILLTRDRGLLKRGEVTHGYCVRETAPRRQLVEVVRRFDLAGSIRPFTRCLICNAVLRPAATGGAGGEAARISPPGLQRTELRECPQCGKPYWSGSHVRRMRALIDEVTGPQREARSNQGESR